jgi:hypothetical protein
VHAFLAHRLHTGLDVGDAHTIRVTLHDGGTDAESLAGIAVGAAEARNAEFAQGLLAIAGGAHVPGLVTDDLGLTVAEDLSWMIVARITGMVGVVVATRGLGVIVARRSLTDRAGVRTAEDEEKQDAQSASSPGIAAPHRPSPAAMDRTYTIVGARCAPTSSSSRSSARRRQAYAASRKSNSSREGVCHAVFQS